MGDLETQGEYKDQRTAKKNLNLKVDSPFRKDYDETVIFKSVQDKWTEKKSKNRPKYKTRTWYRFKEARQVKEKGMDYWRTIGKWN